MATTMEDGLEDLTVATLKERLRSLGQPVSGRKQDLIDRLRSFKSEPDAPSSSLEISLEPPSPTSPSNPVAEKEPNLEPVLDAEILVAELIDTDEPPTTANEVTRSLETDPIPLPNSPEPVPATAKRLEPATLGEQFRDPKFLAALALTLLLVGAGWWWTQQDLDPFTAEPLRYGDSMEFTVRGGELLATDEWVTLLTEQLGLDEEVCKVDLEFSGSGSTRVTEGGALELFSDADEMHRGAVQVQGGAGATWLSVEEVLEHRFDDLSLGVHRLFPGTQNCDTLRSSTDGRMDLTLTSWSELQSDNLLRSEVSTDLQTGEGSLIGTAVTFDLGGVLNGIDGLAQGLGLAISPALGTEIFGSATIQEGASGTYLGWSWEVLAEETVGSSDTWKVRADLRTLEDACLGRATVMMWFEADAPWAIKQTVDVVISDTSDATGCRSTTEFLTDQVAPNGELELRIEMQVQPNGLDRGTKPIQRGSYEGRPTTSSLRPPPSALIEWGSEGTHPPDRREGVPTLEDAVSCLLNMSNASGARAALGNDGYVWRALENRSNPLIVEWNVSWIDDDGDTGWVDFDQNVSGLECTFRTRGSHDNPPTYDRSALPPIVTAAWMETRLATPGHHPGLASSIAFEADGFSDDLRIERRVTTAGGLDVQNLLDRFDREVDPSAVTLNGILVREDAGWEETLTFASDSVDGRLLAWSTFRTRS